MILEVKWSINYKDYFNNLKKLSLMVILSNLEVKLEFQNKIKYKNILNYSK